MSDNMAPDVVPSATYLCRCEEILDEEVIAALLAGASTVDDVKRRTRAGMGICQGIFCMPAIAALVSQATGTPIDRLASMTARPPLRPIPIEALADLHLSEPQFDGFGTDTDTDTGDARD